MVKAQKPMLPLFNLQSGLTFLVGCFSGGLVIGAVFLVTNKGTDVDLIDRSTEDQDHNNSSTMERVAETNSTTIADQDLRSMNLWDLIALNPVARKSKLKVFITQATEDELDALFLQTKDLTPKELTNEFQDVIVEHFALINPKRAIQAVIGLRTDFLREATLVKSIFNVWSVSDLDQAIQYAKEQDESFRQFAVEGILTALDDLSSEDRRDIVLQLVGEESLDWTLGVIYLRKPIENPKETWDEFMEENRHELGQLDYFSTGYLGRVAHALAGEIGLEAALSKIDSALPDGTSKSSVYRSFLQSLSTEDPYQALELAIGLDDVRHSSAITGLLAQNIAAIDPEGAVQIVSTIRASGLRNNAMRGIINTWIENDPYAVMANLELVPENQRTKARVDALVAIAADSTAAATRMLPDVNHFESKVTVAEAIFTNLAKNDMEAAVTWLQSDPNVAPLKKELMPSVIADLATKDPQYAMQIAQSVAIDESEVGLEALVIKSVAETNIDKAIAMLPDTRNEKTRASVLTEIGNILVRDGDAERAIELGGQITDERERTLYFATLVPSMMLEAPTAFVDNLESFPNNHETSLAVQAMMILPTFTSKLTDEQRDRVRERFPSPKREGLEGVFDQIQIPAGLFDGLPGRTSD